MRPASRPCPHASPLRPASLLRRSGARIPAAAAWLALALFLTLAALPAEAQDTTFVLDTLSVEVGSRTSPDLPVRTRSVEVVTREELRNLPVRTTAEALDWTVGLDLQPRSPAQADVSLRGSDFEQVLVLVNGVRVSDAQTGHFDLDLAVPLEQVERIEVLRGPASAVYGADAMGGVINVVTRDAGSAWSGRAVAGEDRAAALSFAGGIGDGAAGLDVGGDYARSDGHREGRDYRMLTGRAEATAPAGDGRLRGGVGYARRDFGARDFYGPYPSYEETRTLSAFAGYEANADERMALEPRISYRRHDDDFVLVRDDPALYRNVHTTEQIGGELVGRYRTGPFRIVAGGEAYRDELESGSLGDRSEARGAVFGELAARLPVSTPAEVVVGAREDRHEAYGGFFSPSISAHVSPSDVVRLRGAASRSFRAPTWTERYYEAPDNVGRADLDPERSWSAEIGTDLAPGAGLRLGLTGYLRRAEDVIDWARPPGSEGPWETRNVQEVRTRGLEATLRVPALLGARWTAGGTLLSQSARATGGLESKYALKPISERLFAGVTREIGSHLVVALRGRVGGWKGRDSSFHRIDAHVGLELGRATVFLDGTNLTDASYPDVTGIPVPGRALRVGVRAGG